MLLFSSTFRVGIKIYSHEGNHHTYKNIMLLGRDMGFIIAGLEIVAIVLMAIAKALSSKEKNDD